MIRLTKRTVGSIGLMTALLLTLVVGGGASAVTAQETRTDQTYTAEMTVTENGSIESVDLTYEVNSQTYSNFTMLAEYNGNDTVADFFESSFEQDPWVNNASVTTTERAEGYELSIDLFNVSPNGPPSVNVTTEGDSVVYRATNISDPANSSGLSEAVYRVTMPGEITDTNADESNQTTATWNLHETYTSELYVEADVSGDETTEGGSDDGGSTASDDIPGFTVAPAVVALCIAILVRHRQRSGSQ